MQNSVASVITKNIPHIKQYIKFGIVGFGSTVIDFGGYFVATRFFHVYYLLGACMSWICAVAFSFMMNKFWTFRSYDKAAAFRQSIKFFIIAIVSLLCTLILMYMFVDRFFIHDVIAKIITIAIMVNWNFFMSKFWTFK